MIGSAIFIVSADIARHVGSPIPLCWLSSTATPVTAHEHDDPPTSRTSIVPCRCTRPGPTPDQMARCRPRATSSPAVPPCTTTADPGMERIRYRPVSWLRTPYPCGAEEARQGHREARRWRRWPTDPGHGQRSRLKQAGAHRLDTGSRLVSRSSSAPRLGPTALGASAIAAGTDSTTTSASAPPPSPGPSHVGPCCRLLLHADPRDYMQNLALQQPSPRGADVDAVVPHVDPVEATRCTPRPG